MTLAEIFGKFAAQVSYDGLPEEVRSAVKPRLLDWIGATLYGNRIRYHQPLFDVIKDLGGPEEATIIGEKVRVPVGYAALVNSAMSFTSPDIERFGGVHISSVIMPAVLALAEHQEAGGKQFITAVVLGYEIATRVARALYPSDFQRGFHPTPVAGALGAATSAGKLLGLDNEGLTHAIAVASTLASGLTEAYGSMQSALVQIGRAAESGILSAILARGGLKGSPTALEGGFLSRGGFLGAYSDDPQPERITEGLGEDFMILRNTIKMYGGCRHNHASIDAVMEVIEKQDISAEQIDEIRVRTYGLATETQVEDPQNDTDLEFHLPFSISIGILEGRTIMADKINMDKFESTPFQDLIKRIKIEHDPQMDVDFPRRWPAEATVKTMNGEVFSHKVDLPQGEPEWPFSRSEIESKFRYLAEKSLVQNKIDNIILIVNRLETLEDLSELISILRASNA